ncbi:MAG: carboxypeptidase regulatory-like domain-containing protein, partial [bacterium]|nr:carboxypeptidase regulatory-like domain-containing protein [bacterium]
ITGRVTVDGDGANLASVVALSPQGGSISTLTNPDGTYRIEGVPPGQYYVYVHPLPPPVFGEVSPANIVLPRDSSGEPIAAGGLFETRFFPGVRTPEAADSLAVPAGQEVRNINFAVASRAGIDLYAVSTYSFPGNVAVKPGHLSLSTTRPFLVASGVGLAVNEAPAPGMTASVIGGSAVIPANGLIPYEPDPRFVQINLLLRSFSGSG